MTALWWIRCAVRPHGPPTLHAALAVGPVFPVFILDLGIQALGTRFDRLFASKDALPGK
jgi:hypothetical protein